MKKNSLFLLVIFSLLLPSFAMCASKTRRDQLRNVQTIRKNKQARLDSLPRKIERPSKLIKDMTAQEAEDAKIYFEIMEDDELVIKALERIISLGKNPYALKTPRFELASMYEKRRKYEKAIELFEEFVEFYPGSAESEQALYKIIKIKAQTANDFRHDQKRTIEIVDLAKKFLEPENNYKDYKTDVEDVLKTCYEKLCNHDTYITQQYLTQYSNTEDKKDLHAANYRLSHCKTHYLPHAPSKAPDVEALEMKIEKYQNQMDEVQSNVDKSAKTKESVKAKFL